MKKTLFSAIFAASFCLPAYAQPIQAILDGRPLTFDQPPAMVGGRVMVPLRGIFEALGANVNFDRSTQGIRATRGDKVVQLSLGSTQASVDGKPVTLDTPAGTVGGRTMVPLRFVSEALGADVRWQESTKTVFLSAGANAPTASVAPPPVQAAASPILRSVIHNGRGALHGGDRLLVTADGDAGGRATFDIVGVTEHQSMREIRPGQYRGEFTVPNGLRVANGQLLVHLGKNGQSTALECRQPVSFDSQAGHLPPPAAQTLAITSTNLAPGGFVDAIFNLQGKTDPNATVEVSGESSRPLIPGVAAVKNQTLHGRARADAKGHFDVQLNASSIPANSAILLKIHATDAAGRQGAPHQLEVTRR